MRNSTIFSYMPVAFVILLAFALGSCNDDEQYDVTGDNINRVYINTENYSVNSNNTFSFSITHTLDGTVGDNIEASFPVRCTREATADMKVTLAVDNELVSTYNAAHGTNYIEVPDGFVQLNAGSLTIAEGELFSSDSLIVSIADDKFPELTEAGYVVPITITAVDNGGNTAISTNFNAVYLIITTTTNNNVVFNAVDISDNAFYQLYTFDEAYTNITAYTFEIKCYINEWHSGSPPISRLCNWGPADESLPNLLRFGESGGATNQLQWLTKEGKGFSSTLFETNTWYTLSFVYDGSTYKMYVDGNLDMSFAGAGQVYELGALELGMSWDDGTGYPYLQRFLGRIAEIRFWTKALSAAEIGAGLCEVDAGSDGLLAYWKLDEGTGNVFTDYTGNGRDMNWPNTVTWNANEDNVCPE